MRALLAIACVLLTAGAGAQTFISVDPSYTTSQRFLAYQPEYPGLAWPAVKFRAGQQVFFDRRYKKIGDRELLMDVFAPARKRNSHTGIVLVHGGAWRSGSKAELYALANLLAQRDYAVFLPNYRLAPEAAYPAGLVDISDAIVWIKANAPSMGLQLGRLTLGGSSSGGQMAALLAFAADRAAFKTHETDDTRVDALIDLDGVLDFTTPLALQFENAAGTSSPAARWLGGSHEQIPERWREASAVSYLSRRSPPALIISSGQMRFTTGKDQVLSALDEYGIQSRFVSLDPAPHTFWLFDPYLRRVVDEIDAFIRGIAG
jgi:acetyl esterase